jgi:monooxygenase
MTTEHVDVLIVGAGLSGIGAACHLRRERPGTSFAILESRAALGGTWDLFRYPGVRSDSDMFTLGYSFRPWTQAKAIADGSSIRGYVADTAREYGVEAAIRFRLRAEHAQWSTEQGRWTVTARRTDGGDAAASATGDAGAGETAVFTCSFLWVCSGYYRYDQGYRPEFAGSADFGGTIVHPQHWPAGLDYAGQRVVVIGSGATAVTLVPAMAGTAGHVTMVQRSPSYVSSLPSADPVADVLRRALPDRASYALVRWKNVLLTSGMYQLSRRRPELMKALLRKGAIRQLPPGFDVDTHFAPSYAPWDQRLCLVPDGDLFAAIKSGRASMVTGQIDRFTATGLRMTSGEEIPADIIVTATGLNLLPVGGLTLAVDGRDVDLPGTLAYKGMMLSGVPNFALTIGYTNASWTLKADLVARYVCRLLRYLDRSGYQTVTPVAPDVGDREKLAPLVDLKSGYVLRSIGLLPRQGPAAPWRLYQNYVRDVRLMRRGRLDDDVRFGHAGAARAAPAHERAAIAANLAGFERVAAPGTGRTAASVALCVVVTDGGPALLITRRAPSLRSHAGQWALPGGRRDPGESATEAALRELHEETGVVVGAGEVLGTLDDFVTRSGYVMTPVVVWGGPVSPAMTGAPSEVAQIHVIPLADFDVPPRLLRIPESDAPVIQLPLLGGYLHAPTAAIVYQFCQAALHGTTIRVSHFEQPVFAWK